jgi:hypothetical protein
MAAGVTQEEVATYLRWFFAFMRVAASRPRPRHEKLKGIPVNFDPADVKAAEETDEVKSIRAKRAVIADNMDAAYGRLRDMLATGQLPGFVVSEDGRMHRLEPWRWNGEDADTAHQRGQMRTARGPNAIIGVAAIPRAELEAALGGSPVTEPPSQPPVPMVPLEPPQPAAVRGGAKSRRNTVGTKVDAVLAELFPSGAPSLDQMTNSDLYRKVAEKMGKSAPSIDTVMRQAGRRLDQRK